MPVKPPHPLNPAAEAAFKTIHYEIGKRDNHLQSAYATIAEETMRLLAASADAFANLQPAFKYVAFGDRSYTEFASPVTDRLPSQKPPALATFGDLSTRKRRWLLYFDDDSNCNSIWDDDEEAAAHAAYERYTHQGLKCTLFVTAYER